MRVHFAVHGGSTGIDWLVQSRGLKNIRKKMMENAFVRDTKSRSIVK